MNTTPYALLLISFIFLSIHTATCVHEKDVSVTQKFCIGALSGGMSAATTEPLLYIKNKLQQLLRDRIECKKRGIPYKNVGISFNPRIMYRGAFISAVGFAPNMAIQNGAFSFVMKYGPDDYKKVLAPLAAGCCSSPASAIRELIIVQQQNHGGTYYDAVTRVGNNHGYHKLFRAMKIIALRNSSFATFAFIATPYLSKEIRALTDNKTVTLLAPGLLAGATSALLTHPLDTIKTNMQAEISNKSSLQVAQELYKAIDPVTGKYGIRSLYAGLFARILGVGLTMTVENNIRRKIMELYNQTK